MHPQTQAIHDDMTQLADDARALLTATAGVAGDKVDEARVRLTAALQRGKEVCDRVATQAAEGARAADAAVHRNPYPAIAIGVGLGALAGFLLTRRCHCPRT
jgi:ElaB/YqjD/DUF883 family membrane-anchored ribosome-binding protein